MHDLLPCPFCGNSIPRVHMTLKDAAWIARCYACDCEGPVSDSEAGAVAAWNCRPDTATITRQAEDARAMHLASVTTLTGLIEALAPLVKLDPEGEVGEWAGKIQRRAAEIEAERNHAREDLADERARADNLRRTLALVSDAPRRMNATWDELVEHIGTLRPPTDPPALTGEEMEARWRAWLQRKNRLDRIAALRTPQGRDAHDEEERAAAIAMHEAVIAELERFALTGVR